MKGGFKMNDKMETGGKNTINNGNTPGKRKGMPRRTALKALAGIPVLGFMGIQVLKKSNYDTEKRSRIIKELGLDTIEFPQSDYGSGKIPTDVIKLGIIGFGNRAKQLSNALGYMHPDDTIARQKRGTLTNWMEQEYLGAALVGICDVYDKHAENGLETAQNDVRPGREITPKLPVKRYRTYQEMLADKDIDAVIIATPDHHHARIATEAARVGKHVYSEKSPALHEDELYELYDTIKGSGVVYQLGHQITQSTVFQQAKEIIKRNLLGKITLVETTTNRNTASGAWIRHLDANGNLKPGDEKTIDWNQWLGNAPYVPFSIERFYSWTQWFDYDHGMIGQLFTHEFDAVNQLLHIGIPKSVSSSGGIYYWKDNREMPDSLHCVFEYPQHELTLLYSGNLMSSRSRGRVFMGRDASMELGNNAIITADRNSTKYAEAIKSGIIDTSAPMISFNPNAGQIDAVTSASEKYYAARGLTTTTVNGRSVDVTHLHLREWLNCIRNGGTPSANIEMAFQEGITCIMAHKSYVEKRAVVWDEVAGKIV
jgi:predicted dehydrogenase